MQRYAIGDGGFALHTLPGARDEVTGEMIYHRIQVAVTRLHHIDASRYNTVEKLREARRKNGVGRPPRGKT